MNPLARSTIGLAFGAFLCASPGCYGTSDAFVHRLAKLQCVNAKECVDGFDETFDSVADCRNEVEDSLQAMVDDFEDMDCEYIAEKGRDCIHAWYRERKNCGENAVETVADSCEAVFVCPRSAEAPPVLPLPLDPPLTLDAE